MTGEQAEPQPLAQASVDELREELARTEQQAAELQEQARELREAVGDTSRDVVDQADVAQQIQQAEQTEEILASVQQRRDRLRERLDELS
jgi:type II secretory pathway component PulM